MGSWQAEVLNHRQTESFIKDYYRIFSTISMMLGPWPSAEEPDRVLSALCDPTRRRLLFELYEEVNTGEENSIKYSCLALYETEERRLELYHVHFPKLEEFGYINWNEAEKTIQKGYRWGEIEPVLELIHTHSSDLPVFFKGKPPD